MGLVRTAGAGKETPELQTPSLYSLVPTANTPYTVATEGQSDSTENRNSVCAGLLTASTVRLGCCILLGEVRVTPSCRLCPPALPHQLCHSWKSCHSRKTALSAQKWAGTATMAQICRNSDKLQLCYPLHFSDLSCQKHFTQVCRGCCSHPWSHRLRQCQFFLEWVLQSFENSYLWARWSKHYLVRKQITG